MVRSADLVAVGRHLKAQAQPFGGALAHEHALEEDFEVIHHGADRLVQLDFQGDDLFGGVDFQLGRQGGVVYLVVLVEGFPDLIADAVAAHVGLVGQDQGRRYGVYGRAAALVVLADGRDDDGDVLRRRAPVAEELEGHSPADTFGAAEFDPSIGDVMARIVPQFVGGMIFGAISESFASEQAARRTAMEAASDNAEEMISSLSLAYNRARQGAITQEITEISSGFEALR